MIAVAAPLPGAPARGPLFATDRAMHLSRLEPRRLRPCPFCGGEAALEPDPWTGESVRITCGDDGCRVTPRTEYLLPRYADELLEAWNGRSDPADEAS